MGAVSYQGYPNDRSWKRRTFSPTRTSDLASRWFPTACRLRSYTTPHSIYIRLELIPTIVYTSLLDKGDGSLLESRKRLDGGSIHLPRRIQNSQTASVWRFNLSNSRWRRKTFCVVQKHSRA